MTTDELKTPNEWRISLWTRLNECECVQNVFGYGEKRDLFYDVVDGKYVQGQTILTDEYLWIPSLFDPIRPERSLIGIYRSICPDYGSKKNYDFLAAVMYATQPDLALAKAIIEQDGK